MNRKTDKYLLNSLNLVLRKEKAIDISIINEYEELVKIQSKLITLHKEGDLKSIKIFRCLMDVMNKMFKKIPKNSIKEFTFVSDLLLFANIQLDMLEKWSEE